MAANNDFRAFCSVQIERFGGAYPDFRFYKQGAIDELVNWLEEKSAGSCEKAAALVTAATEFAELPGIAVLNETWERLFPSTARIALPSCRKCSGTGWEVRQVIVDGETREGVLRCQCGGYPPPVRAM